MNQSNQAILNRIKGGLVSGTERRASVQFLYYVKDGLCSDAGRSSRHSG